VEPLLALGEIVLARSQRPDATGSAQSIIQH